MFNTDKGSTSKNHNRIKEIMDLRSQGYGMAEIAETLGTSLPNVHQLYKRECNFRETALAYPFVEYISTRTLSAIRKCLGIEILATPEKLAETDNIRALICWPGVGAKTIHDLAGALEEAGYEAFDPELIYANMFHGHRTGAASRLQAANA
ncbi:MAG: hypothetical protein ACQERN_02145 [Thermodesulfobacteriota bacterium]